MQDFNFLRLLLFVSVVIYFIFDIFDKRQVNDEREELIRLKTYELVHRITVTTVTMIAILYFFFPMMGALYPVLALVLAFLYTEIAGKIYFRMKF